MSPTRKVRSYHHLVATALVLSLLAANTALGQEPGRPAKAASTESPAWAGITSLEQFLSRTLATHPEVVAAEAKVASAEAELRRTRFEIARELIVFWSDWKTTEGEVARLKSLNEKKVISLDEMIGAKAKLAKMESQLPYLLGTASGTYQGGRAASREMGPKRLPQGPEVEKVRALLDELTELQFIETPLGDVVDTLEDYHKIQMTTDPEAAELPVTASMKDVPLGAALQMVEDTTPGVRFVVTDYGILVTADTSEHATRYISVNEFWREQMRYQVPSATQRPAAPQADKAKEPPPAMVRPSPASSAADPFAPGPGPAQKDKPASDKGEKRPSGRDPFAP